MTIREIFELAQKYGLADTPLEIDYTCNDDWYCFYGYSDDTNVNIEKMGKSIVLFINN